MVGPEIWRETLKIVKNEKCTLQGLDMARKVKNVENETQTLTWNKSRKTEKHEKREIHTVGGRLWQEN